MHNGSNTDDIHRSLKYCKNNKINIYKINKYKINIFYTLKKTNLKAERKTHSNR